MADSGVAWGLQERLAAGELIRLALAEDLGAIGDLTSQAVISPSHQGRACFIARQPGVIAGLPIVEAVLNAVDRHIEVKLLVDDGVSVAPAAKLAVVTGSLRSILTAERTALNFLQRLSGVASLTKRYVDQISGINCQLLDTRKTTPGWRLLEKYAVRCGGGHNHRKGLYDAIMLKDNHLAGLRHEGTPIAAAIQKARASVDKTVTVEIEVENLVQLREALSARPDIVLLDNMPSDLLRDSVLLRNQLAPTIRLEASGGITLQNLREIAQTGVDCISVGALTHSAPALDIALDYED